MKNDKKSNMCKNYDSSKIKLETLRCFSSKEQKSNQRKTKEMLEMKKNEKKKKKRKKEEGEI